MLAIKFVPMRTQLISHFLLMDVLNLTNVVNPFCRLETGVSRVLREDGGSAAQLAHLDVQVLSESKGFEVKEDQMGFRGPQAHQ